MSELGKSVLEKFVFEAIEAGADEIEIEYKGGYDLVFAMKNGAGFGIGRLRSSTAEAANLRKELRTLIKHRKSLVIGQRRVELRVSSFDSFGETAFRVTLRHHPE
jgi:hypothetical protein